MPSWHPSGSNLSRCNSVEDFEPVDSNGRANITQAVGIEVQEAAGALKRSCEIPADLFLEFAQRLAGLSKMLRNDASPSIEMVRSEDPSYKALGLTPSSRARSAICRTEGAAYRSSSMHSRS